MIHSLWVRLLLAFMLVLGVALGGLSFLASRSASTEFHGFMERSSESNFRRLLSGLERYYLENQGWAGVQTFVERVSQLTGDHILLADNNGTVVADSDGVLIGQQADILQRGAPVMFKNSQVGIAYMNPGMPLGPPPGPPREMVDAAFLSSVNRSILLSASVSAVLALILTLVLSRRILRPIGSLTAAVRAMERGDLIQRVNIDTNDEVGELAQAFNSMAESLARNEQLRKNMVTDVAHELRTPLSNIRGYLEAIRDGVIPPDRKTLDSVYEESIHLSRLVDDLQELALAEARQLKLNLCSSNLADVVDRALRASAQQASEKRISLSSELSEGLPPVNIDPIRIGQVLKNLISNAMAYTPEGGSITVSAVGYQPSATGCQPSGNRHRAPGTKTQHLVPSTQSSWLRAQNLEPTPSFVLVSVQDTGSGIPPEHLPHLFERFYRVDPSRSRSTGGSGIGLAISRQLVEAHGGKIWAESRLGVGSTFHFILPVAAPNM